MRTNELDPVFVEFIPRQIDEGKLYISMEYATTVHLCASGCGQKVVLPLSPAEWQLHFDGEAVTLSPSVGNWEYPCQSHYWIRKNRVQWAKAWTKSQIEAGKHRDQRDLDTYFTDRATSEPTSPVRKSPWRRLWDWLSARRQ